MAKESVLKEAIAKLKYNSGKELSVHLPKKWLRLINNSLRMIV